MIYIICRKLQHVYVWVETDVRNHGNMQEWQTSDNCEKTR